MENSKIILLIGRSGKGKSALANVVTDTDKFKESDGSSSETKKIQCEQFSDEEDNSYQIIDTPGIGDTKMSDNEVLDIIAEAVYLARNGISQVLFIFNDRFDQYEMATYDLLRTIIFDKNITKYTTIVRTKFPDFKKQKKCKEDIDLMINEAKEKRIELEKGIIVQERKLAWLITDEIRHKDLSDKIEKSKKELNTTNLAEIIESCQGKIVHVDNPSMSIIAADDEDENKRKQRELLINLNKKARNKSREKLLKHLKENCQTEPYKPEKLKELSNEIADDYFEYLKKKEELQKEFDKLNSETKKQIITKEPVKVETNSEIIFTESNKNELIEEESKEKYTETRSNIEITDPKELIAQLQDKKEKLKKEIAEKEKIIRQKVLKHIFNNYQAISQELGGDIFLNSISGNSNWKVIDQEFSSKEVIIKWLSQGFSCDQTKNWATALKDDFNPKIDAGFCSWLRDIKKLSAERVKRLSYPYSIIQLRKEYTDYLEKQNKILADLTEYIQEKWTDIHPDFAKKNWEDKTYQQIWKENNLTYQDAQEWIKNGFNPDDYYEINQWKSFNFSSQEAKSWKDTGILAHSIFFDYAGFANYLRQNNYTPATAFQEKSQAQHWLDWKYPTEKRKKIYELRIWQHFLEGSLEIKDFISLEKLELQSNQITSLEIINCPELEFIDCSYNQLTTRLNLQGCPNLRILYCSNNLLTNLDLSQNLNLEVLWASNNNFLEQDLSFISHLVNLKILRLGNTKPELIKESIYNRLIGSLKFLKDMTKLEEVSIPNTDLDSGLEYLPDCVEEFSCSINYRKEAKCQSLYNLFVNKQGEVKTVTEWDYISDFSLKLQSYKKEIKSWLVVWGQQKSQQNQKLTLEERLKQAFQDAKLLKKRIEELEKELAEAKNNYQELLIRLIKDEIDLDNDKELNQKATGINKLENNLSQLKKELEEKETEILNLQKELLDRDTEIKRVNLEKQLEIEKLKNEKRKLELEFNNLKEDLTQRETELKEKEKEQKNIKEQITDKISKSTGSTKLLWSDESKIKEQIKNKKQELQNLREKLKNNNNQKEQIESSTK